MSLKCSQQMSRGTRNIQLSQMVCLGPPHCEVAFAIDCNLEWVGKFTHERAVGCDVSPRQEIRASIRPLYQLATVERAHRVADQEIVSGESERAKRGVGDEVVRAAHRLETRFLSARGRVCPCPSGEQQVVAFPNSTSCGTSRA